MSCKGTTMPPPQHQQLQHEAILEVAVVSGEGVRLPSGRSLGRGGYAVVHTASSSARTHADDDPDCDGHPYWGDEQPLRVALPAGARWLDVEICRAHGGGGGRTESVAAARVPAEDFSVGPPGHLHCLSYRLFDSGRYRLRRNGIVNITVRRIDGAPSAGTKAPAPATGKAVEYDAGASGSSCGAAVAQGKPAAPAGAVMGYPVGV